MERLGKETARDKITYYCKYQERSHKEVKEKLYSMGLYKSDVEELMSWLIENDFLNEERFAEALVRGKFRMKHWGKVKIRQALQQRDVSNYNIKKSLSTINNDDYLQTLHKIAKTKWSSLKETNVFIKRKKVTQYLLQKGYEYNAISPLLKNLEEENG